MNYSYLVLIKRMLHQGRNYWLHLCGIFFLNLIGTPIGLMKPLALKILIDSGFGSYPVPGFITFFFPQDFEFSFKSVVILCAALVILIALIQNLHTLVIWILNTYTGEKLVLEFRSLFFNHIQRLSLAYHDRKGTSDSLYRIQYDTTAIRTFLIGSISPVISAFITLIGMIVVMFLINFHFGLIALCIIPPLVILTRISTKRLRKDWKIVKEYEALAMAVVNEVLGSLRVVKAFGQEEGEGNRFLRQANKVINGQLKVAWTGALFYFVVGIMFATATSLFIYYGAFFVDSGKISLGELTIVMAYLSQIYGPLEKISKNLNDLQSSIASIDRVYALLDKEGDVKEAAHPVTLHRSSGGFSFLNVSFSYQEDGTTLKNITFSNNPGVRIGIMGSTGAGKSTLISLLTRLYDPTSGKILLDGHDIRDYKLKDYRNQFAIVLQEPVLFSTTIGENIAYGRPGASKDEIIKVAKLANAHDFILNCKDGYDSLVGERGMQLSGGERQRISLARAFIKDAPILILDEPTSSLDVKTESLIMEAMERLMEGRTTFLITHRLETLKSCDVILHMERGQLVDIIENFNQETLEQKQKAFSVI